MLSSKYEKSDSFDFEIQLKAVRLPGSPNVFTSLLLSPFFLFIGIASQRNYVFRLQMMICHFAIANAILSIILEIIRRQVLKQDVGWYWGRRADAMKEKSECDL